jgi:glutaredoxin-like protein NrdH
MYNLTHVSGENKGKLVLYALSTCVWCKKTRKYLDDLGVEYNYVYVDQLNPDDSSHATDDIKVWNPACSFPTLVINNEKCIVGFKEDALKEALGI